MKAGCATAPRAVVFAYHNVGVRCLSVLLAHGVDVACVVSHEDNPAETIWFDSVAILARRHGIRVMTPENPNLPAVIAELAALRPDYMFSFYYRRMLSPELLAIAPRGAWNMHGSLLPKYRGRVPVNWALVHGEQETGATLHEMVAKPDAGRIAARQAVPILPNDTALDVFHKVTWAAEIALDRALPALLDGSVELEEQDLAAGSYFGGRQPEDGRIDWNRDAGSIHNLIRAVAPPFPGAFSETAAGRLDFLGSQHPAGATGSHGRPTLFAEDGRLLAECGDGRLLRLHAVKSAGRDLDAANFSALIGTSTLPLS